MKKLMVFILLSFLLFCPVSRAMGNSQNQDNSQNNAAALDQAKKDYAAFLQKLDEMSKQYGQVTQEAKKVIKEQGVPVWDEKEDKFKISHDIDFSGNGPVSETDREIKVVLEKPGLRKGSIRVTIEDDKTLRLRAFKKSLEAGKPDETIDEKYELPSVASDARPQARYEDGILSVTIQKSILPKKTVDVPVHNTGS